MRIFVFLCAAVFSFATTAATVSTNFDWFARTWQTEDGLPNNNVNDIAQTSDGFLWVATSRGLARFDGVSFDDISLTNFISKENSGISTLFQNHSCGLTLETGRGLILKLDANETIISGPINGLPDLVARKMVEDDDGTLWISYLGGAVCFLKNGQATAVAPQLGLPWSAISSIVKDAQGRIWLSRDGQVGIFRNGRFQSLAQPGSRSICLATARDGGIWICAGAQLFHFNEGASLKKVGDLPSENSQVEPSAMIEDRHGAIWVGTAYDGLFRFDGSSCEKISVSHPEISSLLEDNEGNIWVGTRGGGLNRLRPRTINLETTQNGLPFESVQSVCEDTHGTLWAVTQNGLLARRNADGWQTISTNAGWPNEIATCVAPDHDGSIWIGTRNHRVIHLQNGQFSTFGKSRGLEVSPISALMVSSNGDLWIGGINHALQLFQSGHFINVLLQDDIRSVRAITQDASGKIWIGTSAGLLLQINGTNAIDETEELPGSAKKSIRCLCSTSDGSLWIGYAGFGLGHLKSGNLSQITSAQGLFDDYISQIVPDGNGWFWFGSDRGIFKARESELVEAAENPNNRVRSVHYGHDEGLLSLEANFGFAPGAIRSRDGRIWIPTRSALAVVNPQSPEDNSLSPPVFLKRIVVDGKTVAAYGGPLPLFNEIDLQKPTKLQLSPNHREIKFEFTALNFSTPENIRLQYRLDGLDNDWIDANPERAANFSRLPSGNYHFRVRDGNSDGTWNEKGTSFAFTVTPFLWQQWWFQSLALILFAAIMIFTVRYMSFRRLRSRLRMLEQQAVLDKERARIARDLHDDLGSHLTKIVLLSDLMLDYRHDTSKTGETAEKVSTAARQVIKTLDETVWAVNPRNDTLPHLIDYIGQFAVEFLRTAKIRCHVDLPLRVPDKMVSTEVRHNLFLVVKEALNNIVNHANATEVLLKVTASERDVSITIEDNGRGFEHAPDNACADGLRNMRQRIEEIGGEFDLQSKPSSGTRIAFTTPLKK
jgi:ligand-binding sensor domain-containing protein/signal transduction histidine kinase